MPFVDATSLILRAAAEGVQPDPELWLDKWSEQNVNLPKGSAFSGPYRLAHTPYARRILQALSPSHPASRVIAMVASQLFKTQTFINAALGWISCAPGNILALEPTDGLAKRLSARMTKAIDACDAARAKVAAPRSRDKRNTIDTKEFDGGVLYITTAGADANLAEISARYVFGDEIDREGWKSGAEGSKTKLAEARQTTFEGISKAYLVSSPTVLGASEIHEQFLAGTQERYHVPCPHCGHLHELVRQNFHYDYDPDTQRVHSAWFACPECGGVIEEHHKAEMLPDEEMGGRARWVQTAEGDGQTISVTLSSYYAPLGSITWLRLARELAQALEAKQRGDESLIQVYENTREGKPFQPGDVTSTVTELQRRAKAEAMPPRIVPDRALVLTLYADTQPNRLEAYVEAWGPGLEHWHIDRQILWGDPTEPPETPGSVWQRLDELRRTPFAHASGTLIRISAYGIDSGGANTQDVYNYGSAREHLGCVVTRGENLRNRPIIASKPTIQDIDWQGQRREHGVKLWRLGTDTAKDWIFNRLRLTDGAGAQHWHAQTEDEVFEQLLVEKPHVRWHKGRAIREYIKPNGARNEALDCMVGNLALAYYLGLHKWSAADWARLRDNLVPTHATPDLFAAAEAAAAPRQAEHDDTPAHLRQPEPIALAAGAPAPAAPAPRPPAPQPMPAPIPPRPTGGRRVLSRGFAR